MTATQDLIDYYVGLLALQYVGLPRASATVAATVAPMLMPQDSGGPILPLAVQDAFNLTGASTAVGVQLDTLGKYVGVTRTGSGFTANITLSDADFLTLIQMAIIKNSAGSSLAAIQDLLHQFFPGTVRVFDYQNMQMNYLITTAVGPQELVQLFVTEKLLPKPMGVQLAAVIYVADITIFFGCRTYAAAAVNVTPFNTYASYQTGRPWLSYANAVAV